MNTRDVQVGQRIRVKVGFDGDTAYEGVVIQKGATFHGDEVPDVIVFTTDEGQVKYALGEVPLEVLS